MLLFHTEVSPWSQIPFWFAYYDLDLRETMHKWVSLHTKAFPKLLWKPGANKKKKKKKKKTEEEKKVRLGIVSSDFHRMQSSIYGCFGATISRLSRDIFDVVFIHTNPGQTPPGSEFVS